MTTKKERNRFAGWNKSKNPTEAEIEEYRRKIEDPEWMAETIELLARRMARAVNMEWKHYVVDESSDTD